MHGETWNGKQDMTGWWISEKYDGIRAYWNGKKLSSRQGKDLKCPRWFVEELPTDISLDGELWFGRQLFETVNGLLNSTYQNDEEWKMVKFILFDIPSSKEEFEARMNQLNQLKLPAHVSIAEHEKCVGNDHLFNRLKSVVEDGGEGLMVNMPNSFYLSERTETLLKIKVLVNCLPSD